MHAALKPLAAVLRLNTDLLLNCLDGLSEEEALRPPPGRGNHAAFLATHLADTRHFLAGYLERPLPNPLTPYLADARSVNQVETLPPLDSLREAWIAASRHLDAALDTLPAAVLTSVSPERFPIEDVTRLGGTAFLVQHDSYHVGQRGLVRRWLGHPPVRYTRRP